MVLSVDGEIHAHFNVSPKKVLASSRAHRSRGGSISNCWSAELRNRQRDKLSRDFIRHGEKRELAETGRRKKMVDGKGFGFSCPTVVSLGTVERRIRRFICDYIQRHHTRAEQAEKEQTIILTQPYCDGKPAGMPISGRNPPLHFREVR